MLDLKYSLFYSFLQVLNDCYNRYKLLMETLQKEAPKQPLIKSLVSGKYLILIN